MSKKRLFTVATPFFFPNFYIMRKTWGKGYQLMRAVKKNGAGKKHCHTEPVSASASALQHSPIFLVAMSTLPLFAPFSGKLKAFRRTPAAGFPALPQYCKDYSQFPRETDKAGTTPPSVRRTSRPSRLASPMMKTLRA